MYNANPRQKMFLRDAADSDCWSASQHAELLLGLIQGWMQWWVLQTWGCSGHSAGTGSGQPQLHVRMLLNTPQGRIPQYAAFESQAWP